VRLLYLTSPELHGLDVQHVQLELRRHHCPPGKIDGYYGTATAAAVRSFQRHRGLTVDGIVGGHTLEELKETRADERREHGDPLPGREPPGLEALAWMSERLGMKESPADSNRCPITAEFGLIGPWCMMAVSLAFKHGANLILGDTTPPPWAFWSGRGFAYVPAFEAWAKTRGYWRGKATPAAGDVACYDWNGDAVPDHVGIVKRYLGGGQFDAVEGNTAVGNDSNGGELMLRRRYMSEVTGFARITRKQP
jgi:peptidoglycan hydrolase-like protein with peptidoglycan-binding domain